MRLASYHPASLHVSPTLNFEACSIKSLCSRCRRRPRFNIFAATNCPNGAAVLIRSCPGGLSVVVVMRVILGTNDRNRKLGFGFGTACVKFGCFCIYLYP
jgi:hypothetical protein